MYFQRNVLFFAFCFFGPLVSTTFGSASAVTSGSVREKFLPQKYSIFSSKTKRFLFLGNIERMFRQSKRDEDYNSHVLFLDVSFSVSDTKT
ncbi:hypothetical protein YC2023_019316 [Brassica napus]